MRNSSILRQPVRGQVKEALYVMLEVHREKIDEEKTLNTRNVLVLGHLNVSYRRSNVLVSNK